MAVLRATPKLGFPSSLKTLAVALSLFPLPVLGLFYILSTQDRQTGHEGVSGGARAILTFWSPRKRGGQGKSVDRPRRAGESTSPNQCLCPYRNLTNGWLFLVFLKRSATKGATKQDTARETKSNPPISGFPQTCFTFFCFLQACQTVVVTMATHIYALTFYVILCAFLFKDLFCNILGFEIFTGGPLCAPPRGWRSKASPSHPPPKRPRSSSMRALGGGSTKACFSIATWRECNHLFKAPSALLHIGNATLGSGH